MKKILLLLFLASFFSLHVNAQFKGKKVPDSHTWIDYSKKYLRIKVSENGIYRMNKAQLNAAGMTSVKGSDLALYNMGQEVALRVSTNGSFGISDYVEFYGHANNGDIDKYLYMDSTQIPNPEHGYLNDTNVYFLALLPGATHKRYTVSNPNFATNPITKDYYYFNAEQYKYGNRSYYPIATTSGTEEHTSSGNYYKDKASNLFFLENHRNQNPTESVTFYLGNVKPNVAAYLDFIYNPLYFGFVVNPMGLRMKVNNNTVVDSNYIANVYQFGNVKEMFENYIEISSNNLNSGSNTISVSQRQSYYSSDKTRRCSWSVPYVHLYAPVMTNTVNSVYQEFYCMAGLANETISFSGLAPNSEYHIINVDDGSTYYVVNTDASGAFKFQFPNLSDRKKFVLVKADFQNTVFQVGDYAAFEDISDHPNSDFLIVTHSQFINSTSGAQALADYKAYRESVNGGSYNVAIVDIDDVRDNFGYGFDHHPLGLRAMLKHMYDNWSGTHEPHCMILAKGISPEDVDYYHSSGFTFPFIACYTKPGGDLLFGDFNSNLIPRVHIGRVPVRTASQIRKYLDKVIEYEDNLRYPAVATTSNYLKTKTGMHLVGIAPTENLHGVVKNDMINATTKLEAPKFGGDFALFIKGSSNATQSIDPKIEDSMLNKVGVNWIAFYGHSSPTSFSFNLSAPENMNNKGKYFHFLAFGCTAGNQYITSDNEYLSERYCFQDEKAAVTFSGTSSNGWTNVLGRMYNTMCAEVSDTSYGKTIGELTSATMRTYIINKYIEDFSRIHVEQWNLCGDPAIPYVVTDKRDYSIESKDIVTNPAVIDGSQTQIQASAKFYNLGMTGADSVLVNITKEKQDGTQEVLFLEKIRFDKLSQTVEFDFEVDPINELGLNRVIVKIDPDNEFDEMSELNNTAEIQYKLLSSDVIPAFPYEFAIVNYDTLELRAYTIDPMSPEHLYHFEMDTTELFDSPSLMKTSMKSRGGVLSWQPNISMTDSTVYYWRVRPDSIAGTQSSWKKSSFVYLPNSSTGWNQSHYYQFLKNKFSNLRLDPDRTFRYNSQIGNVTMQVVNLLATPSMYQGSDCSADVGSAYSTAWGCKPMDNIHFIVIDSITGQPWLNSAVSSSQLDGGRFMSIKPCRGNDDFIFAYGVNTDTERKQAMDFLDSIPDGCYVALYNMMVMKNYASIGIYKNVTFAKEMMADTLIYGSGNSLYHKLQDLGFTGIDSFYKNRPFCFFTQKGISGFPSEEYFGMDSNDVVNATFTYKFADAVGNMQSPPIGTSYGWTQEHWRGTDMSPANPTDQVDISITELDSLLQPGQNVHSMLPNDTTIDFIDYNTSPYLKMTMTATDNVSRTPIQLDYWRINYDEAPDLALDPATVFEMSDTVYQGQDAQMKISIRNLSHTDLDVDSVDVIFTLRDPQNNSSVRNLRIPAVHANEVYTLTIDGLQSFSSGNYFYGIFVNNSRTFNEQTFQNNSLYGGYFVSGDNENPLLDVTFDDIHIINDEIVSPTPEIVMEITDNNKFLLLNDTSLFDLKLSKIIQGSKTDQGYSFASPEVNFIPAVDQENKAFIELRPTLTDGDYVLDFNAQDRSGNGTRVKYSVKFKVVTKSSITNILNYPNPFTSSTRFVFTLTGSKIPENMMIQIFTVTGKLVKEIKYSELGPLHIGTNITDYAWDGRDAKGDPVANGVYLYRVRASIDGKDIEHRAIDADRAFVEGIGKMYIVR